MEKSPFLFPQHQPDKSPSLAIREGKWKLLMNRGGSRVELYDIEQDRTEKNNVAAIEKKIAAQLSKKLLNWWNSLPTYVNKISIEFLITFRVPYTVFEYLQLQVLPCNPRMKKL